MICCASSIDVRNAASPVSFCSMTWFTRPTLCASEPSITRPLNINSFATDGPTTRGRRWVPPYHMLQQQQQPPYRLVMQQLNIGPLHNHTIQVILLYLFITPIRQHINIKTHKNIFFFKHTLQTSKNTTNMQLLMCIWAQHYKLQNTANMTLLYTNNETTIIRVAHIEN